ncbi:MAG: HPF/RaiA family ribosome-associated protein [Ginsengibacter sp.]
MKINLQTIHFKANDAIKTFVDDKVGKLARFDSSIISAEVTLTDDGGGLENKTCDIRLIVPGNDNFVKKSAASFEEAIAECVSALQGVLTAK